MSIAKEAYKRLYPERELGYKCSVKYSGKFNSYNANIRLFRDKLQINMSKNWRNIDEEIKIGLIQELMNKLFKTKIKTNNIDFYNIFMKKIGLYAAKTKTDPVLEESFDRVNERYFYGFIDKPNFEWCNSKNKLGSYDFGTDTITITKILADKDTKFLDYVMYHEILHKKLKFYNRDSKTIHHSPEFRKKEKEFEDREEIERELKYTTKIPKVNFVKIRNFFK